MNLSERSPRTVCNTHGQRCDSGRAQWSQRSGMTSLDPRVTRLVLRTKASNRRKPRRHFLHGVCAIWYSWNARHSDSLSPVSDPWGWRFSCETKSGIEPLAETMAFSVFNVLFYTIQMRKTTATPSGLIKSLYLRILVVAIDHQCGQKFFFYAM